MKLGRSTRILLAVLLAATTLTTLLYLTTRTQVPDHTLAVEYGGKTYYADLQGLRLTEIHGERVDGKGEVKPVDGMGVPLYDLLAWVLSREHTCETVVITASDGFSAKITREELMENGKVVLLLDEEDGSLQLIVFGDRDSKRSVKDVERLTIE